MMNSLEIVLSKYPNIIMLIIAIFGWAIAGWQYFLKKKIHLSIDSKDNQIFCYNNSEFPIEITHCTVELYNFASAEKYANKKQFIYSPSGIIKSNEEKIIVSIDNNLMSALEELSTPLVKQAQDFNMDIGRFATIKIYITCKKHIGNKLKRYTFKRMLSGHPSMGYGIGYMPYHFENMTLRKMKRKVSEFKHFIKNPKDAIKNHKNMKEFQTYLNVCNIITGFQNKKITEEETTRLLGKELKAKGDDLAKKVNNILKKYKPALPDLNE